jgi:hypothetical protein
MNKEKRRVIYVDAGHNDNKEFQIALFDPEINLTSIIKLNGINNNNIAEKYAVVNAITYIKSKELTKTVILSDNEAAVRDPNILKLCEKYKIKITWIPREINIVADKVAKLQPTKKDDTFYTIDFIYDLIFPDIENVNEQKNTKNAPESKLQNNNTKKIEK